VFPSEVEGLPNAVIEAALHEKPIVACDVPGVRDVVRDREEALLVPPRDPARLGRAILTVMADGSLRARIAQAGKRRADERYTIERVATALCDLYDEVLARQHRCGGRP
jgi:glycosyltransferase involved in cell wall biosynthesis